jgi:exosortase/archaeosortase family protein
MSQTQLIKNKSNKTIVSFIIRFVLLFAALYLSDMALKGLAVPGGYYSEWVASYFNYVSTLRNFILHGAALIVSGLGYQPAVTEYCMIIPGISTVKMVFSCVGTAILCFWWAFVLAFPLLNIRQKIVYLIAGTGLIIILNIFRVACLAMIRGITFFRHSSFDHHMVFNIVVYGLIMLMVRQIIQKTPATS